MTDCSSIFVMGHEFAMTNFETIFQQTSVDWEPGITVAWTPVRVHWILHPVGSYRCTWLFLDRHKGTLLKISENSHTRIPKVFCTPITFFAAIGLPLLFVACVFWVFSGVLVDATTCSPTLRSFRGPVEGWAKTGNSTKSNITNSKRGVKWTTCSLSNAHEVYRVFWYRHPTGTSLGLTYVAFHGNSTCTAYT